MKYFCSPMDNIPQTTSPGQHPQGQIQRGDFLEVKIIKNVKKILKLMENPRLTLRFSQEIQTETLISHFNLKGDLVCKIYVWGDIWGEYVPDYISEGGYVLHYIRYIHVKGGFSGQPIFHFIYLINLIGQKWCSTEFTFFIAFTAWFFFSKFSSSDTHEMSMTNEIREILVNLLFMVEDAAGLDCIKDKVAKRIVFFMLNVGRAFKSNRMNSWYSRKWKSLDAYKYCK